MTQREANLENIMTDLEINKAIHEKVMGECWHDHAKVYPEPIKEAHWYCEKGQHWYNSTVYPDYCSDMNAVHRAIDKVRTDFREQNPDETQFFVITDCGEYGWLVDVKWGHHDGDVDMHVARNVSLSRALAEAVLRATGNWEGK